MIALAAAGFALLVPLAAVRAGSAGPLPGGAGVPAIGAFGAEALCTACHDGYPLNPDREGSLELRGLPQSYVPGERYAVRIAVRHTAPEVRRWGFQLTAVGPSGAGEGEFALVEPERTRVVIDPSSARSYLEHTLAGSAPGRSGGASWSFEWIAPSADRGDVAFFGAGNAADLDGSKAGDRIYSPSPAPLALVRGPVHREGERP